MIEPISYGWICPCCGRVYNPRQEMCLYCGPEEKKQTLNNLGDWISTNPCIVGTQKGPTNIPETNGAKGSPYYTTTTGSLNAMEIPIPDAIPMATLCSGYDTKNKFCNCVREPFESDCQVILSKCTEYNNEKR